MIALLAFALATLDPPVMDPRLAERVAQLPVRARELHWMLGGWNVERVVPASPPNDPRFSYIDHALNGGWLQIRDSDDTWPERLSFIGYDPVARNWICLTIDRNNDVVRLAAPRWENGRAVFEGDARILGRSVRLRRTIARGEVHRGRYGQTFSVLDEERVGGRWRQVALRRYTSRPVN